MSDFKVTPRNQINGSTPKVAAPPAKDTRPTMAVDAIHFSAKAQTPSPFAAPKTSAWSHLWRGALGGFFGLGAGGLAATGVLLASTLAGATIPFVGLLGLYTVFGLMGGAIGAMIAGRHKITRGDSLSTKSALQGEPKAKQIHALLNSIESYAPPERQGVLDRAAAMTTTGGGAVYVGTFAEYEGLDPLPYYRRGVDQSRDLPTTLQIAAFLEKNAAHASNGSGYRELIDQAYAKAATQVTNAPDAVKLAAEAAQNHSSDAAISALNRGLSLANNYGDAIAVYHAIEANGTGGDRPVAQQPAQIALEKALKLCTTRQQALEVEKLAGQGDLASRAAAKAATLA